MSASKLVTTTYRGGRGGGPFDDRGNPEQLLSSVITKIVVWHTDHIIGLQIALSDGRNYCHGHNSGSKTTLEFETGESVKRIEGRSDHALILALKFVTNKRVCGPYGGAAGSAFEWGAIDGATRPMRLLAFVGHSGADIDGLQAVFAEDYLKAVTTVRYESLGAQEIPAEISTAIPTEVSKWFSGFARHIMNRVITLYVGPDRVKFHAYEDTLCQIPFFSAGLQGNFKEVVEKVITLPEEDPSHVSAFIEFLCTGNYTCIYDPASTPLQEGSSAPVGDLRQGMFHIGVHVIASKYDCPALDAMATKNFEAVATELDIIDALRLWQAAYADGLRLPSRKRDLELYCDGRGLVAWVKLLFAEHKEEMEKTMLEYPALSCDLLQISVSED